MIRSTPGLTGQKPFVSDDMTSLMFQIAKEKHTSARKFNPKIPLIVEKVIDKALIKDVNQRYQNAGLMAEHLRKIIERIDQLRNKRPLKNNKRVISDKRLKKKEDDG